MCISLIDDINRRLCYDHYIINWYGFDGTKLLVDDYKLKTCIVKGMEHVPNIFMSFDKYLFLEVINILI